MGLRDALEVLVGSEPFERLLLERARPIVARAEAGEDFVVAGVATALEAPLLAVAPGPREAEALAADLEAFLGPERVALLPAWEALPYEGISPAPDVAARRADAVRRTRRASGPFVLMTAALAAMQGLVQVNDGSRRGIHKEYHLRYKCIQWWLGSKSQPSGRRATPRSRQCTETVRLPLVGLSDKSKAVVRAAMVHAGLMN